MYLRFSQHCRFAYFQWYLPRCLLSVVHIKRINFPLVCFTCYRLLSDYFKTFRLAFYVKLWSIWKHITKGPNISVEIWKCLYPVPKFSDQPLISCVSCQPSPGVSKNTGTILCTDHSHFLTFFSFVIHNNSTFDRQGFKNLWIASPTWHATLSAVPFLFILLHHHLYIVNNMCVYTPIWLRRDCIWITVTSK
jgi:hypothetical protein